MKKAKKGRSKPASRPGNGRKSRKSSPRAKAILETTSGYETSSLNPRASLQDSPSPQSHQTQSGDLEGISDRQIADSESVEELVEEGQDREGEMVEAIEDAPDPDQAEVTVHKSPRGRPTRFKDRNRL